MLYLIGPRWSCENVFSQEEGDQGQIRLQVLKNGLKEVKKDPMILRPPT